MKVRITASIIIIIVLVALNFCLHQVFVPAATVDASLAMVDEKSPDARVQARLVTRLSNYIDPATGVLGLVLLAWVWYSYLTEKECKRKK